MGFEKLMEKLDNDASESLYAEVKYHNTPTDGEDYSLPYRDFESEHEYILSDFFEKVEKLAEKNPKKDEILGILNAHKNKISAYERLYGREYCKMAEQNDKDVQAFENKFWPPYQNALNKYLESSMDFKKQMAGFDKTEISKMIEKEKTVDKNSQTPRILPAWLRSAKRFKGNTKSEKITEKEFEPER